MKTMMKNVDYLFFFSTTKTTVLDDNITRLTISTRNIVVKKKKDFTISSL